ALDLLQHAGLQAGCDVGKKDVRGFAKFFRQLRIEIREDVELGNESFPLIKVLGILPCPEKALAGGALEAKRVNFAAAKDGFVFFAEVVAHDANRIAVREEAGGPGEVRGGAADDAVHLAVWAFDGIECDGTYDEK